MTSFQTAGPVLVGDIQDNVPWTGDDDSKSLSAPQVSFIHLMVTSVSSLYTEEGTYAQNMKIFITPCVLSQTAPIGIKIMSWWTSLHVNLCLHVWLLP